MAEGIVNHVLGDRFEAVSAGTEASYVNPTAIEVLKEIGIDISHHRSKNLEEFSGQQFDHVITLCGDADEKCPLSLGGVIRTHVGFPDPAKASGSAELYPVFRKVRDDMKAVLIKFLTGEPDSC